MTELELKTLSTVDLMRLLSLKKDSFEWNFIIYELTCRMYVPFNNEGISFDELLIRNGYKIKEVERIKIKK